MIHRIKKYKNISLEDYLNVNTALLFAGLSDLNFVLHAHQLNSYDDTVKYMNQQYNKISSIQLKKKISYSINEINEKYKNINNPETEMNLKDADLDQILKFIAGTLELSKRVVIGTNEIADKCAFTVDLNEAAAKYKINKSEKKTINKIFDCYIFSEYIKSQYSDQSIYSALKQECHRAYSMLNNEKGIEVLLKHLPEKFLENPAFP